MAAMIISKEQARHFLVNHHHLTHETSLSGKKGILSYLEKTGSIQYDPLNIVGYNPELVLQPRIKDFRKRQLYELLYADRKLVDGWDKNLSIYRVTDWPYFKRNRELYRNHCLMRLKGQGNAIGEIRAIMREKGPLSSADIKKKEKVDWPWAPTRIARAVLESMFFWGEAVIFAKNGNKKIYDFAEQYIDKTILDAPDPNQTESGYFEWQVKRRVRSVGCLWAKGSNAWLGINNLKSEALNTAFKALLDRNQLVKMEIEGIKECVYCAREDESALEKKYKTENRKTSILAPLDNLIWDRKLIQSIFGFDYTWEVYKPAAERKYGYYVLPVLYGNAFIARCEPLHDRKKNALVIKNWWWEKGMRKDDDMEMSLTAAFTDFAKYLEVAKIDASAVKPDKSLAWFKKVVI